MSLTRSCLFMVGIFNTSPAPMPANGPRAQLFRTLLARDRLAEQFAVLAIEARQLHLLDRIVVGWSGIDRDARQQHAELEIVRGWPLAS